MRNNDNGKENSKGVNNQFSYQPTNERSYQPQNDSSGKNNPKPPKAKSAEK